MEPNQSKYKRLTPKKDDESAQTVDNTTQWEEIERDLADPNYKIESPGLGERLTIETEVEDDPTWQEIHRKLHE